MNGTPAKLHEWSPRRVGVTVVAGVVIQAVLIYWFSEKSPRPVGTSDARPLVQMAPQVCSELLMLADPTLFARANPNGFSGPAWLSFSPQDYRPAETNGAPQWLALLPERLGRTFREFVQAQSPTVVSLILRTRPEPTPTDGQLELPLATRSFMRVSALDGRNLISIRPLPSWPAADILPPSEVSVLVDAKGNPVSAVLLASSGNKAADLAALDLTRQAQFSPAPSANVADPEVGLSSSRLVFHWHTVVIQTNGVAIPP